MFYDELVEQYRTNPNLGLPQRRVLAFLQDEQTKRILFDAKQAALFVDLQEFPTEETLHRLRFPFDQLYLEFTEPISIPWRQGDELEDALRGFIVFPSITFIPQSQTTEASAISGHQIVALKTATNFASKGQPLRIGNRIYTTTEKQYAESAFHYDLANHAVLTSMKLALTPPDPSTFPLNMAIDPESYFASTDLEGEGRHIGYWERSCHSYGSLVSWVLVYLMSKSIGLQQEPISRQVRRQYERSGEVLRPWHICKIEPKWASAGVKVNADVGSGSKHGYRYDVIGHLRLGRHRVRSLDGSWSYIERFEWIAPHQRGLANELYIPKTYLAKGGKRPHPVMANYLDDYPSVRESKT